MAARLGVTAASDAIEMHGGNGYIENWPVARILRDAQVNTIWEGADNILCLDVRRAIEREDAHLPLLERMEQAASSGEGESAGLVRAAVARAGEAIDSWQKLDAADRPAAELRLFPLAQLLARTYAAAVMSEQAAREAAAGDDRRAVLAGLWVHRRLSANPWEELNEEPVELTRFDDLMSATSTPRPDQSSRGDRLGAGDLQGNIVDHCVAQEAAVGRVPVGRQVGAGVGPHVEVVVGTAVEQLDGNGAAGLGEDALLAVTHDVVVVGAVTEAIGVG